ncbi:uncharacterized protein C8R40DRAFT_1070382 [Lentinula edodes]|uniref:uncharacterized protein n=1 Tax=Lentinula edodes TaxID=5353 RepID=UPI001E8D9795|nr:uncharacterized protein C8R40DRAFT_1070382 [Lentinula edodes]KAH7874240.1 hypothetical protein C8R40DRAFT_1070382 [Lentinula edodes]
MSHDISWIYCKSLRIHVIGSSFPLICVLSLFVKSKSESFEQDLKILSTHHAGPAHSSTPQARRLATYRRFTRFCSTNTAHRYDRVQTSPSSLSVFIITAHSPVDSHYSAFTSNHIPYPFFNIVPNPPRCYDPAGSTPTPKLCLHRQVPGSNHNNDQHILQCPAVSNSSYDTRIWVTALKIIEIKNSEVSMGHEWHRLQKLSSRLSNLMPVLPRTVAREVAKCSMSPTIGRLKTYIVVEFCEWVMRRRLSGTCFMILIPAQEMKTMASKSILGEKIIRE